MRPTATQWVTNSLKHLCNGNLPERKPPKRKPPKKVVLSEEAKKINKKKASSRERKRMALQNIGFDFLRAKLPYMHPKKLSKIQTLRKAMKYITHLQDMLLNSPSPCYPSTPTGVWAPAPNYYSWIVQQQTATQDQHNQNWPVNTDAYLPDEGFVGEWEPFYTPSN